MATVYDGASGPEVIIDVTRAYDGASVKERAVGMFLIDPDSGVAYRAAPATPATAAAQDSTGAMKAPVYTFLGEQLDVAITSSTGLTVPAGTRFAIIQAKGAAVKYRYNSLVPTAAVGMSLANGGELLADVGQTAIAAMRFIQAAATATLDVAYFS